MYHCAAFLVLLLLSNIGVAAQVEHLYQAEVPVSSKSEATYAPTFALAMEQVLVKITGQQNLQNNVVLSEEIKKAQSYVSAFNYIDNPSPETRQQYSWLMVVDFSQQAIDDLLKKAELAAWSPERPLVLFWVILQEDGERHFMRTDLLPSSIATTLNQLANRQGIPVLFPMLDLEDINHVDLDDVWQGDTAEVEEASQRYQSNAIVMLRLIKTDNKTWNSLWTLIEGKEMFNQEFNDNSHQQVLTDGMNWLAQQLKQLFKSNPIKATDTVDVRRPEVLVTIMDISDSRELAKINRFLTQIPAIQKVDLISITSYNVQYQLETKVSLTELKRILSLDNRLQLVASYHDMADNCLYYRWRSFSSR